MAHDTMSNSSSGASSGSGTPSLSTMGSSGADACRVCLPLERRDRAKRGLGTGSLSRRLSGSGFDVMPM